MAHPLRGTATALPMMLAATLVAATVAGTASAASARPAPSNHLGRACSSFRGRSRAFENARESPLEKHSVAQGERGFAVIKLRGEALKDAVHRLALALPKTAHPTLRAFFAAFELFQRSLRETGPRGNFTLVLAPIEGVVRAAEPLVALCEQAAKPR